MKKLEIYDDDIIDERIPRSRLVETKTITRGWENGKPVDMGPFQGKAYYLTNEFDWVIGEDATGETILVPLKK